MEFEDEEHEEQEEEEEEDAIPITSYNPLKMPVTGTRSSSSSSPPPSPLSLSIPPVISPSAAKKPPARYRECLKNHAVGMGGHAVDGCGEFMPAGADGTIDALKCAACNCHRNFHRKEVDPAAAENHQAVAPIAFYTHPHQPPPPHHPAFQFNSYSRTSPGAYRPLALPAAGGGGEEREREMTMISNPMAAMGLGSSVKKRFRTKFTAEQKEKMLELAEKIGWRFQKQDEEAIQHFCHETGLKRKVLKVWMHNNKQNYLGQF